MIFTHPYYFEEIQLSSDQPYTLIVEDGFMYRNLIHELLIQNQSKRSIIRTYDKNHFQVHLTVSMGMVLHTKLLMDFF